MKEKSKTNHAEQNGCSKPSVYTVDGKKFIVEPVFKNESSETLGEILLKLIKTDSELNE